jgi:membrane-associated phospholipid phosphatase
VAGVLTDSSAPSLRVPGWLRPAGVRVLTWWPVKLAGTAGGMTLFFAVYFWVLRHPQAPVTLMPLTAVDRWTGFQPAALPVYLSLWVYVSLAPALVVNRRELVSFGVAWIALSVIGLGIFLFWPTAVLQAEVDWSQHPHFAFLKSVDAAGNACPSLHVAFAVFSAVWLGRSLRELGAGRGLRTLNWLWCLGILYSTVATRQHAFLDVLAGAGLGALVAAAHLRWLRTAD